MANAMLAQAGIPEEHHAAVEAADNAMQANGQIITAIIGLFTKFGPVILTVLPQVLALIQSGGSWQTILTEVATLLAAILTPAVPLPPVVPTPAA